MLEKSWDQLAIKYCSFYSKDANYELLRFSIINENEEFLKFALNNKVFSVSVLDCEKSCSMYVEMLKNRTRCDFIINILLYSDFHSWSKNNLAQLYSIFAGIQSDKIENNLILLLYNPILSLAITCELLYRIGNTSSIYKRPTSQLAKALQNICDKLVEQLNEDLIRNVYLDTDFRGQTLLRIIVNLELEPLLKSQKVEELIEKLWTGKDTYECDGRTPYFSKLAYISKTSLKFLPGKDFTINDLIKQDFDQNIANEKFWYQFDFRRYSIKYIFAKEFISALFVAIFFQYVNYRYILSFIRENFTVLSFEKQVEYIENDLQAYESINALGVILSAFSFYSV